MPAWIHIGWRRTQAGTRCAPVGGLPYRFRTGHSIGAARLKLAAGNILPVEENELPPQGLRCLASEIHRLHPETHRDHHASSAGWQSSCPLSAPEICGCRHPARSGPAPAVICFSASMVCASLCFRSTSLLPFLRPESYAISCGFGGAGQTPARWII